MQYFNLPIVQVGKEGVNKEYITKFLKDHKMIKVKFLEKAFVTTDLPGKIIKKIGKTIILKDNTIAKVTSLNNKTHVKK